MTIQIGFSTSRHPVSAVIRWVTNSKVSHTWLLYYAAKKEKVKTYLNALVDRRAFRG